MLVDNGAQLEVIGPDDDAAAVMGANLMDPQLGPAAVEAGLRQGAAIAAAVGAIWGD